MQEGSAGSTPRASSHKAAEVLQSDGYGSREVFRTLAEGVKVEYELGESPKGPQATNVRTI